MPSFGTYSANKALPGRYLSTKYYALRRLTPSDISRLKTAHKEIESVLAPKKSPRFQAPRVQAYRQIIKDIENIISGKSSVSSSEVENISRKESIQSIRDEVLRMVSRKSPMNGIQSYRGKSLDGDPVIFFKNNYSKYINENQEVIFSIDLAEIDKPLLTALRNSVPTEKMPLGNRAAKTDAIIAGRFSDGEDSVLAAQAAKLARIKRQKNHLISDEVQLRIGN